jgi:hypothetical protein
VQRRPPFANRTTLALILAGAAALLAGGACGGDSTGPGGGSPQAISVGDTIAGSVSSSDTQRVYTVTPPFGPYAVFLQTLSGNVVLTVTLPGSPTVIATALTFPNRPLLDNATPMFFGQGNMEVRVTWNHSGPASFRFAMLPVNTAPETHSAMLALGDTVSNETLSTMADIDDFTFPGKAGQPVVAMIQALGAVGTGTIVVDVGDPGHGLRLGFARSSGGDSTLDVQTTGVFFIPATQTYHATVSSQRAVNVADANYAGPYRLEIIAIDSAPELASPLVSSWDTVTDAISPIGDVDAYTFSGTAGQEFNLFLQARSGSATDIIHALVPALATIYSVGSDSSLLRQGTGRFALPSSGQFKILVYGDENQFGGDRGPYRLSLYPINRKPESSPDSIAFGDSVLGERIDFPGDVDEFKVVVPDSSGVTVLVQPGVQSSGGTFTASLLDSTGHLADGAASDYPDSLVHYEQVIGPGRYTLRAEGTPSPFGENRFQGSYRLWLYPWKVGPEVAPDTIAIGDTISTETLYPLGDMDHYVFHGKKGDHFSLELQGMAPAGPGGIGAYLTDQFSSFYSLLSPEASDSLGGYQTNRIDIVHDGWYDLTISGGAPPPRSTPEPYRFALTPRTTTPEVASAALTFGDSVTGEAIDYRGDWDQFTITGTPGQKMLILGQMLGGNGMPTLTVFDTSVDAPTTQMLLQPIETVTDTFTIPASGQLQLAVREPHSYGSFYCYDAVCGNSYGITGPYRLVTLPFNSAPESVPAAFALGDTVRGETIAPAGDVDEFTSSATPGDSLVEWFRLPVATAPAFEEITMQVIDPATGAVLAGEGASMNAPTPYFVSPGAFRVPASGNYLVRVFQYNPGGGAAAATGQYEFYVAPAP